MQLEKADHAPFVKALSVVLVLGLGAAGGYLAWANDYKHLHDTIAHEYRQCETGRDLFRSRSGGDGQQTARRLNWHE